MRRSPFLLGMLFVPGMLALSPTVALAEPPRYAYRGAPSEGLTRVEQSGKWGFVDAGGATVIPLRYQWAEPFAEGLAAVKQAGSWGFIDRTGKDVISLRFQDATSFSEGLAAVKGDQGWSYVDKKGTVRLAGPFEAAGPFRCGLARVRLRRVYLLDSNGKVHGEYFWGMERCRNPVSVLDADDPANTGSFTGSNEPADSDDSDVSSSDDPESRDDVWAASFREIARDETPSGEGQRKAKHEVTRATRGRRVDAVVVPLLFAGQGRRDEGDFGRQPGRGVMVEPQWQDHVWQVIDLAGTVVAGAERRGCPKR